MNESPMNESLMNESLMNEERTREVEGPFSDHPDDDHPLFGSVEPTAQVAGSRQRSQRRQKSRRKRRHRIAPLIAFVVILVLIGSSYALVRSIRADFVTPDYQGAGQGSTRVKVAPGDGADDIAATMLKAGVVKSTRAFVNAAKKSGRSSDIQPGVYKVPLRASGAAAVTAVLNPANKLVSQVTIREGLSETQVLSQLASKTGLPLAQLSAAAKQVANLGLPAAYKPTTAEGFLYPSTYDIDPGTSAEAVIQTLTTQFGAEDARLGFQAAAKAIGLTPYQALIIASIVEGEAKFDADRAKVTRVILNRIAKHRPLQIDATSVYAARIAGIDPAKVNFATINSPYNGYTHVGLPPTPINSPGATSLQAAVHPAAGSWLFYVNGDAAGHLSFFTDEASFVAAANVCRAKGWGCA